jgi:hypothetical protein
MMAIACRFSGDVSPLPTLAPTGDAPQVVLPELDAAQVSFSDVSLYEAAMRPGFEGDLEAFADGTRYWLDVDISPPPYTVVGQENVRFVNTSDDTLKAVVFRLYPNHLAGSDVMLIGDVEVDGVPVEPILSVRDTVLEVPLPEALPPGGETEIAMVFGLAVPPDDVLDTYGRLSDLIDVLSLPSFFPMLSVYQAEEGDWWRETLRPGGDPVYSESALFEVQLTVPDDMVVATVGQTLNRSDNGDGASDYHIVTGPVRDFAIYMSEDYEVASKSVNGVTVNVFSLPGSEDDDTFALESTHRTLDVFDQAFGEYPYAELDVVETGTLASGIEYPGLFVLANSIWDGEDSYFEVVLAHEAAHMWWYGLVGNDQVGQPWLDEGLAQYSEFVYFNETAGAAWADGTRDFYAGTVEDYLESGGQDMPVGLPVASYSEQGYRTFVYFKAPLFFDLLEETYGQEAMTRFLQAYYEEYKYGVATTDGLQSVAEEVFGEDLDPLFEEWVRGGG